MKKIALILTSISFLSFAAEQTSDKLEVEVLATSQAITRGTVKTSNNVGQFDKLVKGTDQPVIVKFYTQSCPSCRTINKHFVALSQQYAAKATFVSVDTARRSHRGLLTRYKIKRIPTFMLFKDGKLVHRVLGPSPAQLKKLVTNFVK